MKKISIFLIFTFIFFSAFASDIKNKKSDRHVHDYAYKGGTLTNELNIKLKRFKRKTSIQIDLVTVREKDLKKYEYDISEYTKEIAEQWGVIDDGILMVVNERVRSSNDIFIFVGSSLKNKISDNTVKEIIDLIMIPRILHHNILYHYTKGINAGIDALCSILYPEPILNLNIYDFEKPYNHKSSLHDRAGMWTVNMPLRKKLYQFEEDTDFQIDVLTIRDLKGHSIDYYANQVAEQWGIEGDRILVVVKKNQGQVFAKYVNGKFVEGKDSDADFFIVAGSNLKEILTDDIITNIRYSVLQPYFVNSEYSEGIIVGVESIKATIMSKTFVKRYKTFIIVAIVIIILVCLYVFRGYYLTGKLHRKVKSTCNSNRSCLFSSTGDDSGDSSWDDDDCGSDDD